MNLYECALAEMIDSVEEHGRTVSISKLQNSGGLLDYSQTVTTTQSKAVFIPYSSTSIDGNAIVIGDSQALFDGKADIDYGDEIIDGTKTWSVINIEIVKPADIVIAYRVQLRSKA